MTARPPYRPIAVRCPHCGAPLEVPDERAQLVVCARCDSHLELTGPERDALRLLSPAHDREAGYDLPLGASFSWKGARYEVVARLSWIEEQSLLYTTRVYVLYHPRKPLLFLDEYHGAWAITHKTHVMPAGEYIGLKPGDGLQTFDGRSWTCEEVVERELHHVDGCLPWIARIGQQVVGWELSGEGGALYEIEASGGEVEYNRGQRLTAAQLRHAMPDRELSVAAPPASIGVRLHRAFLVAAAGVIGVLLHVGLLIYALGSGRVAHTETFTAPSLSEEVTSAPFELTSGGLTRVVLEADRLDNAWMAVDLALVRNEDAVVHVSDAELAYYHGVEGGESWSEGSTRTSVLLRGAEPGTYRLLLHAVSTFGETPTAERARHGLRVEVVDGYRSRWPAMLGLCFSIVVLVCGVFWRRAIKEQE